MRYFVSIFLKIISQSLFYNQSSIWNNSRDLFKVKFKRKSFQIIRGHIKLTKLKFENKKAKIRKGINEKGEFFTEQYFINSENEIFDQIINKHDQLITKYLGENFIKKEIMFFKNYNIPSYLESHDIYSNIWHQDSHDGYMLIKIFLLLEDVGEKDGPFFYLERQFTKKYFPFLRERWSFDKFKTLPRFKEEISFTGKKGDYLIINTANCMHRASIPSKSREMAQLTLKPKWIK